MAARILTGGPAYGLVPDGLRLDDYLFRYMEKNHDKVFLINATHKRELTFGQVLEFSKRLARGLQVRGLGKGDVMTLYGTNSEELVITVLAGIHAGLTVSTLNPAATPYELRHYLKELQPKVIYSEEGLLENMQKAFDALSYKPFFFLRTKHLSYPGVSDVYSLPDDVINIRRHPVDIKNDVAFILFSSGTSGLPKGVMLTQYAVLSHLILRTEKGLHPEAKTEGAIFPMYHAAGMFSGLLGSINTCTGYLFLEKYNLKLLLEAIDLYKPEKLGVPPTVIVQLSKTPLLERYDISSVQFIGTGAAPLKRETEEIFKKRFNHPSIRQGYGMTETTSGVVMMRVDERFTGRGVGSSGKPGRGVSIKIIHPETGVLLGPDEPGEILIHTPTVMKGYLNKPEATAATVDKQGWVHTGDVGYYDNDGYIYISGRLKELIKYKGNQVAPAELEALLLQHPAVADVGVVGVPDTSAGELPRAYVVRQAGSVVTEDDLHRYVNERVSHYKRLRGGLVFVPEIPKLASGKILRRKLKELAVISTTNSKL